MDPINFDALFQDGVLSLAKDDAAKAVREFEYLNSTYTQNPQVRYQLARAYLLYAKSASAVDSRNAMDSADGNLTEAIKLDPHFDQAILLLSELKIRKGAAASAVDLLTPLTKEQPQIAQAHYLLASALSRPTTGRPSLNSLSANDGIVPERSSTSISGWNDTARATPAGGSPPGIRKIT